MLPICCSATLEFSGAFPDQNRHCVDGVKKPEAPFG